MGYDVTISGLLRKRAEMAGQVSATQAHLSALITGLAHIDAAIRIFKPGIELEDLPASLPVTPYSGARGDTGRILLDELRKANHPLSTFDLSECVMRSRGLDPTDRIVFKLIARRTGDALGKLRAKGIVASQRAGKNAPLKWELAGSHSPPTH
jgi:hypothetical protein